MFYLDSDTSHRVAEEMVEQLDLADHDVPFISEFIDYLIMCLVPGWRPLNEEFSSLDYTSTAENGSCNLETEFAMENESMLVNEQRMINNLSLKNGSDDLPNTNRLSSNSTLVHDEEAAESIFGLALAQLLGISQERKPDSDGSSASMKLLNGSGSTRQCLEKDEEEEEADGLQSEIDDIKEHYRHLFEELTRMREVAFENVRKRWMRKMGKRPA